MFGHLKWCPLKFFCLFLPFGAGNFSLLSEPLAPLCVWKQLLPHLYRGAMSSHGEQPSSSQGSLAGHCRLWHLRGGGHQSLHGSQSLIWPRPGPGCPELSGFVCSALRAPVPTKTAALKSRKRNHQGSAGAGIRRGRRLVMRCGLCVLGRLIR